VTVQQQSRALRTVAWCVPPAGDACDLAAQTRGVDAEQARLHAATHPGHVVYHETLTRTTFVADPGAADTAVLPRYQDHGPPWQPMGVQGHRHDDGGGSAGPLLLMFAVLVGVGLILGALALHAGVIR
jgi:hypothetical protein